MKIKVFTLQMNEDGIIDDQALHDFSQKHHILQLWENYLPQAKQWLIMLAYKSFSHTNQSLEDSQNHHSTRKINWQDELDPFEYQIFEHLRKWRMQESKSKGIPPHFILKNKQLVDVIRLNPKTLADLKKVKGIGDNKANEFGTSLIKVLQVILKDISSENSIN